MGISRRVALAVATLASVAVLTVVTSTALPAITPNELRIVTPEAPDARATVCGSKVPSDFNGDGFGDLAKGEYEGTVSTDPDGVSGAVRIIYGTAAGLNTAGNQFLQTGGYNELGAILTSGHFNDDCYADVAAYVTGTGSGMLTVMFGSPAGVSTAGRLSIPGDIVPGAGPGHVTLFGYELATGDFDGDGRDDLAIGVSEFSTDGGGVAVVYGAPGALDVAHPQWITQDASLPPQSFSDGFGSELAVGDFTGDGRDDLAVGAPYRLLGGRVTVLAGSALGLDPATGRVWGQNTAGVPGVAGLHDHFGNSLAAGDVNGDGRDELAVGTAGEGIGAHSDAGMVTIFRFGADLSVKGFQSFTQDTPGVPGEVEPKDMFGFSVEFGDFNGDGRADLAVGSPEENVGGIHNTGSVTVLYGGTTGLTTTGSRAFSQNTLGVPGVNEADDLFGAQLQVIPHGRSTRTDLLVFGRGDDHRVVGGIDPHDCGGTIVIINGSATGLTGTGGRAFYRTSPEGGSPLCSGLGVALA